MDRQSAHASLTADGFGVDVGWGQVSAAWHIAGRFRQFGWEVEHRRHVITSLLGLVDPLPVAAVWGHERCDAASPLWVYAAPAQPFAACRRVWERRPNDAVGLFGVVATDAMWGAMLSFSSQIPLGAAVWVASTDDLRRGIARVVHHRWSPPTDGAPISRPC